MTARAPGTESWQRRGCILDSNRRSTPGSSICGRGLTSPRGYAQFFLLTRDPSHTTPGSRPAPLCSQLTDSTWTEPTYADSASVRARHHRSRRATVPVRISRYPMPTCRPTRVCSVLRGARSGRAKANRRSRRSDTVCSAVEPETGNIRWRMEPERWLAHSHLAPSGRTTVVHPSLEATHQSSMTVRGRRNSCRFSSTDVG